MNKLILDIANKTFISTTDGKLSELNNLNNIEQFAKMLVSKVLDEVSERAYYCGDRAWSDELDRQWIELEFGFGNLSKNKKTA